MATKSVVKVVTDAATQVAGFNKERPEKVYVAYGRVPSTGYAVADVLKFDQMAGRDIVYAKFVTANGGLLEMYNGTDVSAPL
jgi:hypothetical protein